MSLATLTFKLWTDAAQTAQYSGTTQLAHKTDLSDNPNKVQFWLGSNEAANANVLVNADNPGVNQITLTPTSTIAEWAASTAYTLGQQVEPVTPNTYYYEVTTAGTSGASEPTWPTTIGNTVTNGTVVFTCMAKKHPTTEIKLALTEGGLTSAVAGASLDLGTEIYSGVAGQVTFWMQITNTVVTASDVTGYPQIGVYFNNIKETRA